MEKVQAVLKTVQNAFPKNKKELDWWITFRKPSDILKNHETFLYCEIAFYILAFLTLVHAMRSGGRFTWLWFATIAHGLMVEIVSYNLPDIDSFWHAQSMVMFLGQRLPLHIMLVYPVFIYTSVAAVAHMNLRWWAEPFAVGLSVVLIDIPFDIMGIKLLWWTWHDDDPNIYDRHYWVPWTSYYFHATFASSFTFIFFGLRRLLRPSGLKFQSCGCFRELVVLIVCGLFSMPLGAMQFVPVYHPLHDSLGIHSEVCVLLLLSVYALTVWSADRYPFEHSRVAKGVGVLNILFVGLFLHYVFYVWLVFTAKPQHIRSIGYHQPVGSCNSSVDVLTPFGQVLKKNKFLCMKEFDEDYFDFKCLRKLPSDGLEWYTVCGNGYKNHVEHITVVCFFCAMGLFWFWQLICKSGHQPHTKLRMKHHRD